MAAFIDRQEISFIIDFLVAEWGSYYAGWGTGSGQVDGDTTLANEAATPRVETTPSQGTTNFTGDTYRHTVTLVADADLAISEVGFFYTPTGTASPGLQIYGDFDPINVATGDAITFQVNIVFS